MEGEHDVKAGDTRNPPGRSQDIEASRRKKKTYTPPVLIHYGPIGKLTQSGTYVGTDFRSMMNSAPCL
jgi:hypothetical protein